MTDKAIEYLDIVTLDDVVVGQASRSEIYANKHPHRIVHVMVRNAKGEFLIHLRSKSCSYLPLYWCTSAGGHVRSGESYEAGAHREMYEEIGITGELRIMGKFLFTASSGISKFIFLFEATQEVGFILNPLEVAELRFVSHSTFEQMIISGESIHPELLHIWRRYYNEKGSS